MNGSRLNALVAILTPPTRRPDTLWDDTHRFDALIGAITRDTPRRRFS